MKTKIHILKKLKVLLFFLATALTFNSKNNLIKARAKIDLKKEINKMLNEIKEIKKATSIKNMNNQINKMLDEVKKINESKKIEIIKKVEEAIKEGKIKNLEDASKIGQIEEFKEIIKNKIAEEIEKAKKNQNVKNNENLNTNKTKKLDETKKIVDSLIELPTKKNKPVVILNPGHGFEDPGCCVKNPYFNTSKNLSPNTQIVKEKILNQLVCYELTLKLLEEGFEVYLVFDLVDLKELGFNLPKNNSSLHILFKQRPPINYTYTENNLKKIAYASAFCIKQIFNKVINNNKDAKIVSLCLHHNSSTKKAPHGLQPFYCNDSDVNETFKKNGKALCNILLNNCKYIYNYDKNMTWSSVKTEKWAVCRFGKDFTAGKYAAALLLELGFVTNNQELKEILSKSKKKEMANAITKSLKEYFAK